MFLHPDLLAKMYPIHHQLNPLNKRHLHHRKGKKRCDCKKNFSKLKKYLIYRNISRNQDASNNDKFNMSQISALAGLTGMNNQANTAAALQAFQQQIFRGNFYFFIF